MGTKGFGQYKKLPLDKFVKKERAYTKIFCSVQDFLEIQFLVDGLVDFLDLLMFINAFYLKYII